MTVGFVLTIKRVWNDVKERVRVILSKACHAGFEKKSYTVGC